MAFLRKQNGDWSPDKILALIGVLLPACWFAGRFWIYGLGPRPVTAAIHFSGDWAVRILWISLAVTPFARLFKLPRLLLIRRTLGVAAFAWVFVHVFLYVVDQKFVLTTVAWEIVLRIYLTIGFVAVVGLALLAATSTDGMIRRLGSARWNGLHALVYPLAVLSVLHFAMQMKTDVWEPVLMAGLLVWLFGYRILQKRLRDPGLVALTGLAMVSAVLTALIEGGWYFFRSGINAQLVLLANFDFAFRVSPAWYVLAAGLAIVMATALWRRLRQRPTARSTSATAASGATRAQSAS